MRRRGKRGRGPAMPHPRDLEIYPELTARSARAHPELTLEIHPELTRARVASTCASKRQEAEAAMAEARMAVEKAEAATKLQAAKRGKADRARVAAMMAVRERAATPMQSLGCDRMHPFPDSPTLHQSMTSPPPAHASPAPEHAWPSQAPYACILLTCMLRI